MPHTGNERFNDIAICGLNAGVQYAPLQWPQFECQLTVQVRAGNIEYRYTLLRLVMLLHITTVAVAAMAVETHQPIRMCILILL